MTGLPVHDIRCMVSHQQLPISFHLRLCIWVSLIVSPKPHHYVTDGTSGTCAMSHILSAFT